MERGATHIGNF